MNDNEKRILRATKDIMSALITQEKDIDLMLAATEAVQILNQLMLSEYIFDERIEALEERVDSVYGGKKS